MKHIYIYDVIYIYILYIYAVYMVDMVDTSAPKNMNRLKVKRWEKKIQTIQKKGGTLIQNRL